MKALSTLMLAALACALPGQAAAQSSTALAVGRIDAEQRCTVYQQMAGHRDLYASPFIFAMHESFITWLVKDCVDNFAATRIAMEGALASSGKFALRDGGYVLSGHISQVSGDGGPAPYAPNMGPGGFSYSASYMFVTMEFTVRDARGHVVFGDVVTKRIEVSSDSSVNGFRATTTNGGEGLYGVLQKQLAQAVARKVAFHFVPMRVTRNTGRTIQLNYGAPLIELGALVQATSPGGGDVVRYRVTSASTGSALADADSDGDQSMIVPGSEAIIIEGDDPAANARRFRKVELP